MIRKLPAPELALFLLGVLLRLRLVGFDHTIGYDFRDHATYVEWFRDHLGFPLQLPPLFLSRETYHPPLYYFIAGLLLKLGGWGLVQSFGIGAGILRLGLIWHGLERYVPHRLGRLAGLALAAVLPASLHLEGMIYSEPLNGLLATAAVLLMLRLFAVADGPRGWLVGAGLGLAIGTGMLTKISAVLLAVAFAIGAAVDIARRARSRELRLRRLAAFGACALALLVTTAPYLAHNLRKNDKLLLTGWDGVDGRELARPGPHHKHYLDRRPLGFFVGWSTDIFHLPFVPFAMIPNHRFWPVLIASTFEDYYNYGFIPAPKEQPAMIVNGRPYRMAAVPLARLSFLGGIAIALTVALAWMVLGWRAVRAWDPALIAVLALPALVIAAQCHFAVKYPFDEQGLIKGVYVQYGTAPLHAVFAAATGWLAERRRLRLLLPIPLLALALVAAYSLYARLG